MAFAGMLAAVGGKLVAVGGTAVGVMFVIEALLLPQPAAIAASNNRQNVKLLNRIVLLRMMYILFGLFCYQIYLSQTCFASDTVPSNAYSHPSLIRRNGLDHHLWRIEARSA